MAESDNESIGGMSEGEEEMLDGELTGVGDENEAGDRGGGDAQGRMRYVNDLCLGAIHLVVVCQVTVN